MRRVLSCNAIATREPTYDEHRSNGCLKLTSVQREIRSNGNALTRVDLGMELKTCGVLRFGAATCAQSIHVRLQQSSAVLLMSRDDSLRELFTLTGSRRIEFRHFQVAPAFSPGSCLAVPNSVQMGHGVPSQRKEDDAMAKKKGRAAGKRDLVKSRSGKSYAKRTARGRFKEMDNVRRATSRDRRKRAKRKTRSGFGDRGDR